MPEQLIESATSQALVVDLRSSTAEYRYTATGYATVTDVLTAAGTEAPSSVTIPTVGVLFPLRYAIDPQGGSVYSVAVSYGFPEGTGVDYPEQGGSSPPAPSPPTPPSAADDDLDNGIEFDIGVDTQHVTQSVPEAGGHLYKIGLNGVDPPDFKGAIGCTKDGKVEGTDVLTGTLEFTVTRTFAGIKRGYLDTLRDLAGKVNNAEWWGFARRDVVFLGATSKARNDGKRAITFKFGVRPTEAGITVADGLQFDVLEPKAGWDYLWVFYQTITEDNRAKEIPFAAYIDQVFKEADFTLLGIG